MFPDSRTERHLEDLYRGFGVLAQHTAMTVAEITMLPVEN